jgi:hypothetical protein
MKNEDTQKEQKKAYSKPHIIVYGPIEVITEVAQSGPV